MSLSDWASQIEECRFRQDAELGTELMMELSLAVAMELLLGMSRNRSIDI